MVAPAAPDIAAEFHITSSVETVLMVSVFVLAYGTSGSFRRFWHNTLIDGVQTYPAFGPLLFAPLSEIHGRVRLLQITNIIFLGGLERIEMLSGTRTQSCLAFNLGCGFARNKTELTALRFMAGLGGGAPLAVRISPPNPILMVNGADYRLVGV